MSRHSSYIIWIWIAAAVLFAGCRKDSACDDIGLPAQDDVTMYVCFHMGLAGSGAPVSRAEGSVAGETIPNETPGTSREDAIERVDLLVTDAESGRLLYYYPLMDMQVAEIGSAAGTVVPLFAKEGQAINVYAAVNMPEIARRGFVRDAVTDEISLRLGMSRYRDVINTIIPGSDGRQQTLQESGTGAIPMSGQFASAADGSRTITVTKDMTVQNPLALSADVRRLVAKVHVLTRTQSGTLADGTTVEYVPSESGTAAAAESLGWIRMSDVCYMLNGTNKSTYIFLRATNAETYPLWQDLNMDLDGYVAATRDVDLEFDESYNDDFTFCDGLDLHKVNVLSHDSMTPVEAYNATTLANTQSGENVADRYTKGMYCMENYFDAPTLHGFALANYEHAIPMVTHVSIAAKLVPRWIVTPKDIEKQMDDFVDEYESNPQTFRQDYQLSEADFTDDDAARWRAMKNDPDYRVYLSGAEYEFRSFRRIKFKNEADALDIINWSLKMNRQWGAGAEDFFTTGKCSAGTFYVYDTDYDVVQIAPEWNQRYLFLTAGAVAKAAAEDVTIKSRSVPHLGGWGYYYTYIDHTGQTADGTTPYAASQVTRNTYYLVTVSNFGAPGGTITRPEFIKVNTEPVGWDYGGRGDINLR